MKIMEVGVNITEERVKELLKYNKRMGVFIWKVNRGGLAKANTRAGRTGEGGYVGIMVDGVRYPAHKLAWLYVYGEYPNQEIDHKDRNPSNNKISNLRLSDRFGNTANSIKKKNATGYSGVKRVNNKYQARVKKNHVSYSIGCYSTPLEAHEAYKKAHKKLHGSFSPY